jgi:hypothetical protein
MAHVAKFVKSFCKSSGKELARLRMGSTAESTGHLIFFFSKGG